MGSSSTMRSASEQYAAASVTALLLTADRLAGMSIGQIDQVERLERLLYARLQRLVHAPPQHHLVGHAAGVQLVVSVLA